MRDKYTQGTCEDGAAILCHGERLSIDSVIDRLNETEKTIDELAMLIRSMLSERDCHRRAAGYLKRKGLEGSILR